MLMHETLPIRKLVLPRGASGFGLCSYLEGGLQDLNKLVILVT